MSFLYHLEDFMRGLIIGKIEERRKISDVAREFDIACSESHLELLVYVAGVSGEVVLEVRRLQKIGTLSFR